jgi:hypothetical protein
VSALSDSPSFFIFIFIFFILTTCGQCRFSISGPVPTLPKVSKKLREREREREREGGRWHSLHEV